MPNQTRKRQKSQSNRKVYERRKRLGLCAKCNNPPIAGRVMCERHRQQQNDRAQKYNSIRNTLGLCVESGCPNPRMSGFSKCQHHRDKDKLRHQKRKEVALFAYGGQCACCGETDPKVLELDHVQNDGAEHRRQMRGGGGAATLIWAKKNGFPDTLQLLCANCHAAKTTTGDCSYRKTYAPACARPSTNDAAGGVPPGPFVFAF